MMKSKKRFRRSSTNQVVAGVLGGIGEYFDWNANLLRILFVVLCLTPGIGIFCVIGYIILAVIVSVDYGHQPTTAFTKPNNKNQGRKVIHGVEEQDIDDPKRG
ncbi:PspC domain-containing protein [Lentilactobacillus senioris]|uniref:PspC domain-containing protein n=1 Tax=Lentilactobacillus senioris TaxID=931534 RepID=UPI002281F4DA|nr:PspC domain-containing protein [Lentilactobacillus senioris]MCY9807195.1 PspC domain-containing protein [Lentilactobacillus senioris]